MSKKESGFFYEFKKFITRGSVLDMAVGMIIGSGFTAIVNSMVKDILNPLIGLVTGGQDFSALKIVLKPAEGEIAEVAIRYGLFINSIVNFLLVALFLFLVIRSFNRFKDRAEAKKKAEAAAAEAAVVPEPPKKSDDVILLEEIRDILKKQN
jgi:large conductance mechanosensitive channel protein